MICISFIFQISGLFLTLEGAINFLGRAWGNLSHSWRKNIEIKLCTDFITPLVSIIENVCMSFIRPCYHCSGSIGSWQSYCGAPHHEECALNSGFEGSQCLPLFRKIPWGREWQPTPAFLPGETPGQRSLAGYSPWERKESDTTWQLNHHCHSQRLPGYFSTQRQMLAEPRLGGHGHSPQFPRLGAWKRVQGEILPFLLCTAPRRPLPATNLKWIFQSTLSRLRKNHSYSVFLVHPTLDLGNTNTLPVVLLRKAKTIIF